MFFIATFPFSYSLYTQILKSIILKQADNSMISPFIFSGDENELAKEIWQIG